MSIYEYACTLLRVSGLEDAGWDPLIESKEVFEDICSLTQLDLNHPEFADPEKTKVRLMLLGYAHLIEMDAPYNVLANLLSIRNKQPYVWDPFWDIRKKRAKKKPVFDFRRGRTPAYPREKVGRIKALASTVGLTKLAAVFDEFYFPALRNSIDHSDYVLHNNQLRMLNGGIEDANSMFNQVVPYEHLLEIIRKTYAFYWSFFNLELSARKSFKNARGWVYPFDFRLKSLLEFNITTDGTLVGFTVHWPNGSRSRFSRDSNGCDCVNVRLDADLTVDFFVGQYFRKHSPFSRLVRSGEEPVYGTSVSMEKRLVWSEQPYTL